MGNQRAHIFYILVCFFFVVRAESLFAEDLTDEARHITHIINKVIDAYGGKEVVEGIHSLHAKGEIRAFMRHDQGTYELYFKRDRKLRVETKYEDSSELRILNSDRGYRSADGLPLEEVSGPRYFSMLYQYKHLDILHDLLSGSYKISFAGTTSLNGNAVEVFRLLDKEGTIMDIFIDMHNFLIVKVTGYFVADDKKTDLSAEFSDFRKAGGSLFPFNITNYAAGMKIAQTVIDKYFINPDISDSLFGPGNTQSL
ncbi:MAG TPA: hypothetical protein VJW95_05835 [Dissulfurispiraceae bacterium]|nr:hypothetical protein [Dissulfurispiraceae bacterium]